MKYYDMKEVLSKKLIDLRDLNVKNKGKKEIYGEWLNSLIIILWKIERFL